MSTVEQIDFYQEQLRPGVVPEYTRKAASLEGVYIEIDGNSRDARGMPEVKAQSVIFRRDRTGGYPIPPNGFTGYVQIPLVLPVVVELKEVTQAEAQRLRASIEAAAKAIASPIMIGRYATPPGVAPLAMARDTTESVGSVRNPVKANPGSAIAGL